MLLATPLRTPALRRAAPATAVLAAVTSLVLAGAAHLLPAAVVVALAGGAGALIAGVRLTRFAIRPSAPRDPHVPATDAAASASSTTTSFPTARNCTARPRCASAPNGTCAT
ncbi:hypothetical protein ABZS42_31010, partial [Micromonospora sp. NPDC005367]